MIPDDNLAEHGLLIVTGSSLRAEQADRPLAYRLKTVIEEKLEKQGFDQHAVVVLSDLWYLNAEALQHIPLISLGGPGVNAVSAHLFKKLANALVVDDTLLIQMDLHLEDLRASIWGTDHARTVNAVEIFISREYLERFLKAVVARSH